MTPSATLPPSPEANPSTTARAIASAVAPSPMNSDCRAPWTMRV